MDSPQKDLTNLADEGGNVNKTEANDNSLNNPTKAETGNQAPAVEATPADNSASPVKKEDYPYHDFSGYGEEEEFTYKPKVGFAFNKIKKILGIVVVLILLIVTIVFMVTKLKPKNSSVGSKNGEIVWWGFGLKKEVIQPLIDEYLSQNPKAKITYIEESPIDYRERLVNSLLQGKGPDIFSFHNSWVPMFKNELDIMSKDVMTYDDFAKNYYPVIVGDMTTGAGVVGLPLEYDGITLFINEDIFSTAGIIPPRTWDEFHQIAKNLTTKNDKNIIIQSGTSLGITSNVDYWPEIISLLLYQNKVDLYKPEGAGAEEALTFYADFYTFDKVWDTTLPSSTEAFADGKAAMLFAPVRAADEIRKINKNLNFRTIPLPQVRKDDPEEPDVSYATYWSNGVWNKSPNKGLAWDFLKFLSSKDSLEKIYKNSVGAGLVGMPYPRIDMRDTLISDSILGSVLALAPNSKSWYLASNTYDGTEGLNSLLNGVYESGITSLSGTNNRKGVKGILETVAVESAKVYSKFGIGPK
jgi:ABC-type glycerol-3-phosphate transport system substrate-binding protein